MYSQINGRQYRLSRITLIGILLLVSVSALVGQTPTPIRSVTSLPATCNGGTPGVPSDEVVLITGGIGANYICTAPNTWTAQAGGATPFSVITSGINTNALVEGNAGSLIPSGTGQITANGSFLSSAGVAGVPVPPTYILTDAQTGGTLSSNIQMNVQVTFTIGGVEGVALPRRNEHDGDELHHRFGLYPDRDRARLAPRRNLHRLRLPGHELFSPEAADGACRLRQYHRELRDRHGGYRG